MKNVILIAACFTFLASCVSTSPRMDSNYWKAVNQISPEFGNSNELAERFSHWPNYTGAYDTMGGARAALNWCKTEASNNYEYRVGNYKPEDRRNYGFITRPSAQGAPRMKPSDPEWIKDCTECMDALGFQYVGPRE